MEPQVEQPIKTPLDAEDDADDPSVSSVPELITPEVTEKEIVEERMAEYAVTLVATKNACQKALEAKKLMVVPLSTAQGIKGKDVCNGYLIVKLIDAYIAKGALSHDQVDECIRNYIGSPCLPFSKFFGYLQAKKKVPHIEQVGTVQGNVLVDSDMDKLLSLLASGPNGKHVNSTMAASFLFNGQEIYLK